jgi:hypothetical protein
MKFKNLISDWQSSKHEALRSNPSTTKKKKKKEKETYLYKINFRPGTTVCDYNPSPCQLLGG